MSEQKQEVELRLAPLKEGEEVEPRNRIILEDTVTEYTTLSLLTQIKEGEIANEKAEKENKSEAETIEKIGEGLKNFYEKHPIFKELREREKEYVEKQDEKTQLEITGYNTMLLQLDELIDRQEQRIKGVEYNQKIMDKLQKRVDHPIVKQLQEEDAEYKKNQAKEKTEECPDKVGPNKSNQ